MLSGSGVSISLSSGTVEFSGSAGKVSGFVVSLSEMVSSFSETIEESGSDDGISVCAASL